MSDLEGEAGIENQGSRYRLARLLGLGGFRYFDEVAGVDIIDVAVNRDIF